jgi:hypothetical protein
MKHSKKYGNNKMQEILEDVENYEGFLTRNKTGNRANLINFF